MDLITLYNKCYPRPSSDDLISVYQYLSPTNPGVQPPFSLNDPGPSGLVRCTMEIAAFSYSYVGQNPESDSFTFPDQTSSLWNVVQYLAGNNYSRLFPVNLNSSSSIPPNGFPTSVSVSIWNPSYPTATQFTTFTYQSYQGYYNYYAVGNRFCGNLLSAAGIATGASGSIPNTYCWVYW